MPNLQTQNQIFQEFVTFLVHFVPVQLMAIVFVTDPQLSHYWCHSLHQINRQGTAGDGLQHRR